jgi:putative transcriptional regulator
MDKNRPSAGPHPGGPERSAALEEPYGRSIDPEGRTRDETAGDFLQGRILIAMPNIGDPRFERTVLLICAHDEQQAMAIALNRPLNGMKVATLLRRIGLGGDNVPEAPVLFGGPVERERGYVLHTDEYCAAQATVQVAEGVSLTDTREVLDALGQDSRRPRRFLLALGYAGWGAGQLESEIRQGVWLTCDADEELVFGDDHAEKWTQALAKIGVSADRLSTQAGRA